MPGTFRTSVRRASSMMVEPLVPILTSQLTPPSRTPWGGRLIAQMPALKGHIPDQIIGEMWAISGHRSFPNIFRVRHGTRTQKISIDALGKLAPENLYGKAVVSNFGAKMPFLVKLLNSAGWDKFRAELKKLLKILDSDAPAGDLKKNLGLRSLADLLKLNNHGLALGVSHLCAKLPAEKTGLIARLRKIRALMKDANLSVQIHPPRGYKKNAPTKTEAWVILDSEKGSGVYLGMKPGVTKETMGNALRAGKDITEFLNFAEVKSGDIFYIPAGTPHAIGAGILLLEAQETSETTYRYYDHGRTDKYGRPRELHVEDALAATNWDTPRGAAGIKGMSRQPKHIGRPKKGRARVETLVNEKEFALQRITLNKDDAYDGDTCGSVEGHVVTEGSVAVINSRGRKSGPFPRGQAFIIPAGMGAYSIHGLTQTKPAVVYRIFIGNPRTHGI